VGSSQHVISPAFIYRQKAPPSYQLTCICAKLRRPYYAKIVDKNKSRHEIPAVQI